MLILNAESNGYSSEATKILNSLGEVLSESCDRKKLLELIPEVNVLIVRLGNRIDREVFEMAVKLKVVVTATTGLNHIELETAAEFGVDILTLRGEKKFLSSITATAELTWALILCVYRSIPQAHNHVIGGSWNRDEFRGHQLQGKKLGLVGYGRLGKIVARYGQAFGMKILACDPYVDDFPDWVAPMVLPELLGHADVISIHVDSNDSNKKLLNKGMILKIKDGAILVNTARGELIDESALLEALKRGQIAGAALDVLDGEANSKFNMPLTSPVWEYAKNHDNVVLVPHIGGATLESMESTEVFMAQKLASFLSCSN